MFRTVLFLRGKGAYSEAFVRGEQSLRPGSRSRAAAQNEERGVGETDYEKILADILRRDVADSTRETAPLKPAEDAIELDTSYMTIDEVVSTIVGWARERQEVAD